MNEDWQPQRNYFDWAMVAGIVIVFAAILFFG